jgi:hypothetical protein
MAEVGITSSVVNRFNGDKLTISLSILTAIYCMKSAFLYSNENILNTAKSSTTLANCIIVTGGI